MTFSEWCQVKFGISEITEGRIISQHFLPLSKNPFLLNFNQLILGTYNAFPIYREGLLIGYSISDHDCSYFQNYISAKIGLNLTKEEYRIQAPLYFHISPERKKEIYALFRNYLIVEEFDPISGSIRTKMHPDLLNSLFKHYYSENYTAENLNSLKETLNNFQLMKQNITKNGLTSYLDKAQALSLDYSNSNNVNCALYQASSAYGISLQAFSELHKNAFTDQQRLALKHAIELLASYDKRGNLKQGLKSDSNFVHFIVMRLHSQVMKPDGSLALISELPNGLIIKDHINKNTHALLHGNKHATLNNKPFYMRRFLPDASMKSETNEIVLQTGGMITHSTMTRLIKVGMNKDGTEALPGTKPDYYNYFKVETNLGAGCHDIDLTNNTCTGTYITQLHPTTNTNGQISRSSVNPAQNPDLYQSQMEHTLTQLIKTERELFFYRQPQTGPNGEVSSFANTPEAMEWTRLDKIKNSLNGTPVTHPISFQSISHDGEESTCWVQNQKAFIQQGGSCPIFSIRQLVTSIIGPQLSSLHSQFLQSHNGTQHLRMIENTINILENRINTYAANGIKSYQDYIMAHKSALQNPDSLRLDVTRPPVPADFTQILQENHDGYSFCKASIGDLLNQGLETMLICAKNNRQNTTTVFNYIQQILTYIPQEFKDVYKLNLKIEQINNLHQSYLVVNEILGTTPSEEQFNILWPALENKKGILAPAVLKDLKIISTFCTDKLNHAAANNFDDSYKSSIKEFYKKAIDIRLSDSPAEKQVQQMKAAAHAEFGHRHSTRRLLADVLLMIGTLFGMGIGRVLTGHSFFWSTAPTARESEFTKLIQLNSESNSLLSPAIGVGA